MKTWLDFIEQCFDRRMSEMFGKGNPPALPELSPEFTAKERSHLSDFIEKYHLNMDEIVMLLMSLCPHIRPYSLDKIIQKYLQDSGDFPEIGGTRGKNHRGFLPTGETIQFMLAGDDPERRAEIAELFRSSPLFTKLGVLTLEEIIPGEPGSSGKLILSPEYLELFLTGKVSHPRFSMDFPAEYITTELTGEDLVLSPATNRQVQELINWVAFEEKLMKEGDLRRWIKPGYRALFHGPAGTGKTLTAMIVGKNTGRDVLRIDLSMVVSKYIGETEKNLSQLFDRARNKTWILFFDEADALFGKRTNVRDAHDKYANQEVAYLLQRIESHNGLVILASNLKSNIDEAFMRRFQSVVYFPPPSPAERFTLWKKVLPSHNGWEQPSDTALLAISKKFEITGAGIVNVIQYCCLDALGRNSSAITQELIIAGIEREYMKEGKVF